MARLINVTKSGAVLSFGELLLRICPDSGGEWLKKNQLPFYVGGAELNVATALSSWELPSKYITAIPDNGMSAQIISSLKKTGIDVSNVIYHGNRIGLYFLTRGADLKHDALVYDRANSSFADLKPGMINWEVAMEGVSWFHFSAICPGINANIAAVCKEALEAASSRNITISVDLNYRSKLWRYGKKPQEVMPALMQYCDLIMGNVWSADTMLDIPVTPDIHESGQKSIYLKEALNTSQKIIAQFPKCKAVANTFRFDEKAGIDYYATLYQDNHLYVSSEYTANKIVDKVGSGDCFMAGLIYGFYTHCEPQQTLNFATAAAFQKLFVEGDATNQTASFIRNTIKYEE